jgi:hypothetical protein
MDLAYKEIIVEFKEIGGIGLVSWTQYFRLGG